MDSASVVNALLSSLDDRDRAWILRRLTERQRTLLQRAARDGGDVAAIRNAMAEHRSPAGSLPALVPDPVQEDLLQRAGPVLFELPSPLRQRVAAALGVSLQTPGSDRTAEAGRSRVTSTVRSAMLRHLPKTASMGDMLSP